METYIGTIVLFGGTAFVPRNFALCNGQLLQIRNNQPLYAVIGAQYGGDGKVTFALPNLNSKPVVASGTASPVFMICITGQYPVQ